MVKNNVELMSEAGREIATMWLERAIQEAETEDQCENQVFTIRKAAQHVLAVCAFNEERVTKREGADILEQYFGEVIDEFENINFSEMELVYPRGGTTEH